MGIYLGATELGGGGGSAGGGGYIPGIIGFEAFVLSGGGGGGFRATYGGGGAGGGTLAHLFAYATKDTTIPITVGAGGTTQVVGGSSIIGSGLLVTTIVGGGAGTYDTNLTDNFGTCPGGRGSRNSTTAVKRYGNGFNNKGKVLGVLNAAAVTVPFENIGKNINDTTTPRFNGQTLAYSGPGGAGLGGDGATPPYNGGSIGGIGLDPTTITDRFLTQAEYQTEGIGEVTSSVAYIGGGGSGYRASGRANPPGGCGADDTAGLANTGGGGGARGSGGSGFIMLRLPTSQSVTTTGAPSTYIKGNDTVYVWKSTGSIILNS